jgi:hypothetical protein
MGFVVDKSALGMGANFLSGIWISLVSPHFTLRSVLIDYPTLGCLDAELSGPETKSLLLADSRHLVVEGNRLWRWEKECISAGDIRCIFANPPLVSSGQ